jgi:hypothetical protein
MKRSIFSGLARRLSLLLATGVACWLSLPQMANRKLFPHGMTPGPRLRKTFPSPPEHARRASRAAGRSVLRPLSQSPGKHGVKHPSISVAACQEDGLASEGCRWISRLPDDAIQERFEVKNRSGTGLHKTKL